MAGVVRKLLAVPAAFTALGRFFWLISQSDDPYRLIYYTKQGDVDRAFETLDLTDEETHSTITSLREDAQVVADEVPEIQDKDREDLSSVTTEWFPPVSPPVGLIAGVAGRSEYLRWSIGRSVSPTRFV